MDQLFELMRTYPEAKLENARTSKGIYKDDFQQATIINLSRVEELNHSEENDAGITG